MDLLQAENVSKIVKFYLDNALNLAAISGVEADAEIKIRVIPNKDKNVDAKFVVVGSGKVVIPGQEEVVAQIKEENPDEIPTVEAEQVEAGPELEVVK